MSAEIDAHRCADPVCPQRPLPPCVHCGERVTADGAGGWMHASRNGGRGLYRCQSPDVAYGHLAHPAGVPCRAGGVNPCLGSVTAPASTDGAR